MSLVVVACVALILAGVMAWLTRAAQRAQDVERERLARRGDALLEAFAEEGHRTDERFAEYREALLAHLEREAQAAREERKALLDRIEAPGASAAREWHLPEAPQDALAKEDREWLDSPESVVPWSEDLALADSEVDQ